MITKNRIWTYDDYSKINDEKRYEVIKGELIMVPAPDMNHQNISKNFLKKLYVFVYENKLGEVFDAPADVIINENNVVQPDIFVILNENIPNIKKRGFVGIPDLIIEIISPSSRYRDTQEKKALYEKYGVKEYWLVEPKAEYIEIFTINETKVYELHSEGYLEEEPEKEIVKSKLLDGLEIDLKEIFDKKFTD